MRQIYHFEDKIPPAVNEQMLRQELEKRRAKKAAILLVIGSFFIMISILLIALPLYETNPLFSTVCLLYVCVSIAGSLVIVIAFTLKAPDWGGAEGRPACTDLQT